MAEDDPEFLRRLLEDSEFWPSILRDDEFWEHFEELMPDDQAEVLSRRVEQAMATEESRAIQLIRAREAGVLFAMIEAVGSDRARQVWREKTH